MKLTGQALKDKKTMDIIRKNRLEAEKHFYNRALMVIETLCGGDIVTEDVEKLKDDVYRIAHSAVFPTTCEHKDWIKETEKMYKSFKKSGL